MSQVEGSKYDFTEDMDEISGFGGPYEDCCRLGLKLGCEWLDEHPNANLELKTFQEIFGICEPNTSDAKALSDHVCQGVERILGEEWGLSGAMHQAIMMALLYIKGNGWEAYKLAMTEAKAKKSDAAP